MSRIRERTKIICHSGVYPIPVFTRPAWCGGDCLFCPQEEGLPRSYLRNCDTAFAQRNSFSAGLQFRRFAGRIPVSRPSDSIPVEIIVLGGSFSAHGRQYRRAFVSELYDEMNGLVAAKASPQFRCSVLTVEARPDQIDEEECRFLRSLGVTKVELGVQHLEDDVLAKNMRGHSTEAVREATRLLKHHGFKIGYHIMLGLPGTSYEKDEKMLSKGLWLPDFSPDYLKVYPCSLLKPRQLQPRLCNLHDKGEWEIPSRDYALSLLLVLAECVPPYVRVSRIQRQFPSAQIVGGPYSQLRTLTEHTCQCVRCREVGRRLPNMVMEEPYNIRLRKTCVASDCYFELLGDRNVLLAIARTYVRDQQTVMLREIRVFGKATAVGIQGNIQGRGVGTHLLKTVEEDLALSGHSVLMVNAAVGAKSFFAKNGYVENKDGFLRKSVSSIEIGRGHKYSDSFALYPRTTSIREWSSLLVGNAAKLSLGH